MNRMISVMLLMQISLVGVSQPKDNSQIVRINNTLYRIEGKDSFEINQNIITVKPYELGFHKDKDFSVIRSNVLGYYDISVPEGEKVENYYHKLQQSGLFDIVKYNTYYSYSFVPNDEYVDYQWHLDTINVYNAWNITMGSPSVKIAVLDSGVDVTHEDIGYGNDTYSNIDLLHGNNTTPAYHHGTSVASVIGAKTNNSVGIAGIAGGNNSMGATIYSYFVGSYQADGALVDDAILDAVDDGVNIIQMTIDGPFDQDLIDAIDYAYNNNVTVVCSSGNDLSPNPTYSIRFPACYEKV